MSLLLGIPTLHLESKGAVEGLILGAVIFAGVIISVLFSAIRCPLRHVPGPWITRFTGIEIIVATIKGRRGYKLEDYHKRYGPIVRISPNEVSFADYRFYRIIYTDAKTVLKDPRFYEPAKFLKKGNIFQFINPEEHAARRKLSAPSYSTQSISALDETIRRKADDLVARLAAAMKVSSTVDAYRLCSLFSFEVICETAFASNLSEGVATGSYDEDAVALIHAMDGSVGSFIIETVFPWANLGGYGKKLPGYIGVCYRNLAQWEKRSREMVDHLIQHSERGKYILTPLIHGKDEFLGRKLSSDELVGEAMGIMFAGSGTTSTTLTYLIYALAQSQQLQERLRRVVASISEGDFPALRANPFVNAVIKETFRLYPTIMSTLPRVIQKPMQIDKYLLPKGTVVGMQNYIHHRQPDVFANPDIYMPERWLKSTPEMEATLTPFSLGRRNCIGQNLAWAELYHAVNAIARSGITFKMGPEMAGWEMEMEDRFNIAPRGKRLMVQVEV
ncbi:cytochrome P450 [Aspergillus spectabilis]